MTQDQKPKIIKNRTFQLMGFSFFGNPFSQSSGWTAENEIGKLWNRFIPFWKKNEDFFSGIKVNDNFYEIHIEHDTTAETGNYEVFIGVEVNNIEQIPIEAVVKILPHSNFAVYTFLGSDINTDWESSCYQIPDEAPDLKFEKKYHLLLYDKRYKGMHALDESEFDVYIPIVNKK